jgi:secreted PhoX family phosphatase
MRKLPFAAALLAGTMFAVPASADGTVTRIATVPLKAEVTGLRVTPQGDLFMNVQHPSNKNPAPFGRATVGAIVGVNFNALPKTVKPVAVPSTDAAKQAVQTALGEYQVLASAGDLKDLIPAGLGIIVATDGKTKILASNNPDFNALVPTNAAGTEGFLFTHWENRPGGMSRIRVAKGADGKWAVQSDGTRMLDFSGVNGTWVNCNGSLSPWGTPLTSEELYFDDTADWNNADYEEHDGQVALEKYLGRYPNPYDYGFIGEITDPTGSATPVKHYTLGRFSHENAVVMPDNRTVYMGDDGTDTVFFKFVADRAGDLSAGTLYAAKVTQDAGRDPAKTGFGIAWIELAHGTNGEIRSWIRQYDGIGTDRYRKGSTNYISDAEIAAWARGEAKDDRVAFLETRKAAAAKGATAEFRKMEGVTINYEGARTGTVPYLYLAMTEIGKGMSDDKGDIRLDENKCGAVYEMKLDRNFNVARMVPAIVGGPYDKASRPNACSVDAIASPDNIQVLRDGRVLVGEDTGHHENNMLWLWTPENRPET